MRGVFLLNSFTNESLYALVDFGNELNRMSSLKFCFVKSSEVVNRFTYIDRVLLGIESRLASESLGLTLLDHFASLFAKINSEGEVFIELSRIQRHV
jgi:hypothetical protein